MCDILRAPTNKIQGFYINTNSYYEIHSSRLRSIWVRHGELSFQAEGFLLLLCLDSTKNPHDGKIHMRLVLATPRFGRPMSIQQEHQLVRKIIQLASTHSTEVSAVALWSKSRNWIDMSVRQPGGAGTVRRIDDIRYN